MHHCEMMRNSIENWVRIISTLKAAGMSQRRIGAAIGVDQATVSRIARGEAGDISFGPASRLLELAGGSIQWPEAAHGPSGATSDSSEASHVN